MNLEYGGTGGIKVQFKIKFFVAVRGSHYDRKRVISDSFVNLHRVSDVTEALIPLSLILERGGRDPIKMTFECRCLRSADCSLNDIVISPASN